MTITAPPTADLATIEQTAALLMAPGDVAELRILHAGKAGTVSGYFDAPGKLAQAAARYSGHAPAVYLTLNPVQPALLARAHNRAIERARHTTADSDIERRRWLLVDFDPGRPSGISATDVEHDAALALADDGAALLARHGWPEPIRADSGNGAHLLYPVDLANTPANADLTRRVLEAFAFRCQSDAVSIDTTVHNAARICKLYGTQAAKGDSTPERPHRLARLLHVPDVLEPVPLALLEQAAAWLPTEPTRAQHNGHRRGGDFDLPTWLSAHHLDVSAPAPWKGGRRWIMRVCPFNHDHADGAAYIVQQASGAIAAGCLHASCSGKMWHDLRALYEPAWPPGTRVTGAAASPAPAGEQAIPPDGEPAPWELPIPFSTHGTLPAFPVTTLQGWLRAMVDAVAEALQVPIALTAWLGLAVVSTACGRRYVMEVKPGHLEPVHIYTTIGLGPGERKSPAFAAMTAPLHAFENDERRRLEGDIAEATSRRKVLEGTVQHAEAAASKAPTGERESLTAEAARLARELAAVRVPSVLQLIADDVTPEGLARLLADNDGRMALLSPEGDTFDHMAGRYSSGTPNLGVYLKGHGGDELRVNRVGRPPDFVPHPALTVGLAVQPTVLQGLMSTPGFRGRGLLGRFFYDLPASKMGRRTITPAPIPDDVRTKYQQAVYALLQRPALLDDADGQPIPRRLELHPDARAALATFEADIEPRLAPGGDLGAFTDWAGKLAGGVARLAALLHLAGCPAEQDPTGVVVSLETVKAAVLLGEHLIPHARAAYALMGGDPAIERARHVLAWLERRGKEKPEFTRRDVYRDLHSRFDDRPENAAPALALLAEHGYIRELPPPRRDTPQGRKPSDRYTVNPAVWEVSVNTGDFAPQDADETWRETL